MRRHEVRHNSKTSQEGRHTGVHSLFVRQLDHITGVSCCMLENQLASLGVRLSSRAMLTVAHLVHEASWEYIRLELKYKCMQGKRKG